MSALLSMGTHPLAIWAGWTALVVLWATAALAVLLAAWGAWRAEAPVEAEHKAALLALALSVASLVAAPLALASWPAPRIALVGVRAAEARVGPAAAAAPSAAHLIPSIRPNVVAGAAGLAWAAGAVFLLLRLAGGWFVTQRVRRRAAAVDDPAVQGLLQRVREAAHVERPVALLVSSEVEAPVVVGSRHPALIVPDDLSAQLGSNALEPLLAHECAHIRRADYAANVAQSVVDALLFFSPPARWISKVVRETREYCCDESAVRLCGDDRGAYAHVLASLAALGSRDHGRPVLGAAGPRLITRVRRLLSEGAVERQALSRNLGVAAALAALIVTAWPVMRVSAAHAAIASPSRAATLPDGAAPLTESHTGTAATLPATGGIALAPPTRRTSVDNLERRQPGATPPPVRRPSRLTAQPISIRVRNGSLSQVLREIADAAGISIAIDTRVPNATGLNVEFTRAAAADVLDFVCSTLGLAYRVLDTRSVVVGPGAGQTARISEQSPAAEDVPPIAVKEVRPTFTPALMKEGIQGTVVVTITVSTEGKVTDTVVTRPLSPLLDAEALRVAKQWEFKPGTRNGVPVDVKTELEFTFTVK